MIACYSETSWKRPNTGERVSGFGDREEMYRAVESSRQESEPDFPKPAEGKSDSPWQSCHIFILLDFTFFYILSNFLLHFVGFPLDINYQFVLIMIVFAFISLVPCALRVANCNFDQSQAVLPMN